MYLYIQVIKKHYVSRPPPNDRQQANINNFISTGDYVVTYPRPEDDVARQQKLHKLKQKKQQNHNNHNHDHNHNHACETSQARPSTNNKDEVTDEVKRLLSRIENDMGITTSGNTMNTSSPISSSSVSNSSNNTVTGSVKVAPGLTPLPRSRRPSLVEEGSVMGDEETGQTAEELELLDADDDYDTAFIYSSVNQYPAIPAKSCCNHGHSHSHHGHGHGHHSSRHGGIHGQYDEDDEETAFIQRDR
jgi:hypothetical protein